MATTKSLADWQETQRTARRIPNTTTCRNGRVWVPRCSLPDTPCRRISHTARCVHESCQVVSGQTASTASSTRHFAMCGTWPTIVSGNRRPVSHPLQSAMITRPEEHPLNYPAERGNLVESHGVEPRIARGAWFTVRWVCRIPHSPKKMRLVFSQTACQFHVRKANPGPASCAGTA